MVDYIRDEPGSLAFSSVERVVSDVPAHTEAFAARALQRLYLRRWLVAVCGVIILFFVLFYQLPVLPAALGFALMTAGSALLPREGLFNVRFVPRTAQRPDLTQLFVALLDGLPAPAILLTARGEIWGFNTLAKDLLTGLRTGEHISAAMRDPHLLEAVSAAAGRGERHTVIVEERVPIARHLEATLTYIAPDGPTFGRSPAILLFLRDLTEQDRANRLRSDFIANASHELRTPLASLIGFIETLQGAARHDPNAQHRFLGIMARQAERMARLIDDLLSLSRVEMHQHLRPQARVDLDDLLRHVVATLEPIAMAAGVSLHYEGPDAAGAVLGDRDELAQVFSNLAHNAVKYGRKGGNVWISVARETGTGADGRFAIAVRDDGPGIPGEHLPRLTERFYRVNANGGEAGGTGLGLAIVKHAVARHRGDLRIESALGKGSTFTVLLHAAP
jgi:two-component system, OmpR family, phosphate regulon sensor histidine kinase PhoR